MEQKPKQSTENFIKEIRRKTRRLFSSEQKLVIVMEAQRGGYLHHPFHFAGCPKTEVRRFL
jgi:hypothetical protein